MKTVIIIPSRMGSSRFPGKPMAKINGREMILHVCDRCGQLDYPVIVATPDEDICELVDAAGYMAVMTGDHATGTDRVAAAADEVDADIIINVQGDEPLVNPEDIEKLVLAKEKYYNSIIGSMRKMDKNSQNVVKVIQNAGQLIYMTRQGDARFAQCGLYAFTKKELKAYLSISEEDKKASLARNENIEIMRFVELGIPVHMAEITGSPAVDMPDDIKTIMEVMRNG